MQVVDCFLDEGSREFLPGGSHGDEFDRPFPHGEALLHRRLVRKHFLQNKRLLRARGSTCCVTILIVLSIWSSISSVLTRVCAPAIAAARRSTAALPRQHGTRGIEATYLCSHVWDCLCLCGTSDSRLIYGILRKVKTRSIFSPSSADRKIYQMGSSWPLIG